MRANKRDWSVKDLVIVANNLKISCSNKGGSHYVFTHQKITNNLSIPKHKDLHTDYITKFIRLVESVQNLNTKNDLK